MGKKNTRMYSGDAIRTCASEGDIIIENDDSFHTLIGNFTVKSLTIKNCNTLQTLDGFSNLEFIHIEGCKNYKFLLRSESIKKMIVNGCDIMEIFDSGTVKDLSISNCNMLRKLKCEYSRYTIISISDCDSFEGFVMDGKDAIEKMSIRSCKSFTTFDQSIPVSHLEILDCENFVTITERNKMLNRYVHMGKLEVKNCKKFDELPKYTYFEYIYISSCRFSCQVCETKNSSIHGVTLSIELCESKSFDFRSIVNVSVENCPNLKNINTTGYCGSLKILQCPLFDTLIINGDVSELKIENCRNFANIIIPKNNQFREVIFIGLAISEINLHVDRRLHIVECQSLISVNFKSVDTYSEVDIRDCSNLKELHGNMKSLCLMNCKSVRKLEKKDFPELHSLSLFSMELDCMDVKLVDNMSNLRFHDLKILSTEGILSNHVHIIPFY